VRAEEEEGAEAEESDAAVRRRMLRAHLLAFNRAQSQLTLSLMPQVEALCDEFSVAVDVRQCALLLL